jgi:hypothetical protein
MVLSFFESVFDYVVSGQGISIGSDGRMHISSCANPVLETVADLHARIAILMASCFLPPKDRSPTIPYFSIGYSNIP